VLRSRLVNGTIKGLTRVLCRVDDAQLARVPQRGPLIIVSNHVNFLEVPLLYTHLLPRPVTGFAKAETWDNPAMAALFDFWEAIPLRRGEADHAAIRRALRALRQGKILALAPEGTRSGDGRLQRGHPGVVTLALLSGAPLLPMVFFGGERLRGNLSRLRRTDFHIVVGRPFELCPPGGRATRAARQRMVDEVMYQLAALLPPPYRGHYADLPAATQTYLRFLSTAESGLRSPAS
jgi:1-acyl-sn-glycerol-3-phosphate acyltransferase